MGGDDVGLTRPDLLVFGRAALDFGRDDLAGRYKPAFGQRLLRLSPGNSDRDLYQSDGE